MTNDPQDLIQFTRQDKAEPVWRKLQEKLHDRLELLRKQNDNNKDPIETAILRGRIAECKWMIGLNEEPKVLEFSAGHGA